MITFRVVACVFGVAAAALTCVAPTALAAPGPAGYYCTHTAYTGAPYYVQFAFPKDPSNKGICSTGEAMSAGQFAAANLTRRCVFDDDKSIAQKGGLVSIYSDSTIASASAAQMICA